MHEVALPSAKMSKVHSSTQDIRLFAQNKTVEHFASPANAISAKGIKIRIRDLETVDEQSETKPYGAGSLTNFDVGA